MVRRAPFNGPLTVVIGDTEHVIGAELSRALQVERIDGRDGG